MVVARADQPGRDGGGRRRRQRLPARDRQRSAGRGRGQRHAAPARSGRRRAAGLRASRRAGRGRPAVERRGAGGEADRRSARRAGDQSGEHGALPGGAGRQHRPALSRRRAGRPGGRRADDRGRHHRDRRRLARDDGNLGLQTSAGASFTARGGTVLDGIVYAADQTDFSATVADLDARVGAAIAANGADAVGVYLPAFDEAAAALRRRRGLPALAGVRWYGSDGVVASPALLVPTRRRSPTRSAIRARSSASIPTPLRCASPSRGRSRT